MLPIKTVNSSLIDWPGYSSLIAYIQGCNLACPYCHNISLINKINRHDKHEYDQKTTALIDKYFADKWYSDKIIFSGGDPLCYDIQDIISTFSYIKNLKPNTKIGIHTNGMSPNNLKSCINMNLVNYVGLDIKTIPGKYFLLNNGNHYLNGHKCSDLITESIKIIKLYNIDHEFRITPFHDVLSIEDFDEICEMFDGYDLYINKPNVVDDRILHPYTEEEINNQYKKWPNIHVRS